jgi:hypothetical protein
MLILAETGDGGAAIQPKVHERGLFNILLSTQYYIHFTTTTSDSAYPCVVHKKIEEDGT